MGKEIKDTGGMDRVRGSRGRRLGYGHGKRMQPFYAAAEKAVSSIEKTTIGCQDCQDVPIAAAIKPRSHY